MPPRRDSQISLRLFGRPEVVQAATPVTLGRRARGIIGYLALGTSNRISRERLMGLFWPDRDEPQARASLRQCLVELRGCLGPLITTDREWVSLAIDKVHGDWPALKLALAGQGIAELQAALAAIGDNALLDGLEFGDAFDTWLRGCRAALDARLAAAVADRIAVALAAGDVAAALALADAWLRRDPRDEVIVAAAITAELQRQNPAAARKRFREIEALLERDGDGPPGPALRAALNADAAKAPAAPMSNAVALATSAVMQLPSKPSIAVLRFADLSGGTANEDFADGMVEEISTVLSRFSSLFVIAGQSSLSYRSTSKSANQIARELGVRYLLEGSIRQAEGRVRIAVKLVDAERLEQIWANRFDDRLANIFDLQDRVAAAVARMIDSTITDAELQRAVARPAASPDSYELTLRANVRLNLYTRTSIIEALEFAEAAVALDPNHSWAVAVAGFAHAALWMNGWSPAPREARAIVRDYVARAVRLCPDCELTLAVAAGALLNIRDDFVLAGQFIDRALTLNPDKAYTLFWAAWLDLLQGRPDRGLQRFEVAVRANPRSAYRPFQLIGMGNCLFFLKRVDEAAIVLAEVIRLIPDYLPAHTMLVASLVHIGDLHRAKAAVEVAGGIERLRSGLVAFTDKDQTKQVATALASLDWPMASSGGNSRRSLETTGAP